MPPAVRGSVHWYDFGPVVGHELSGNRPALIVSNTELNRRLQVAIAIPISTAVPSPRHLRNHVYLAGSGSWASVRQIKTVDSRKLGDKIAEAAGDELETAVEILVERLSADRNRRGPVQTASGEDRITPGTLCTFDFHLENDEVETVEMLLLDYNHGNGMGIAVEVERHPSPNSPVRTPIKVDGPSDPASALVHRVRSIDVPTRIVDRTGTVDDASLMTVGRALLAAVDR